MGRSRFAAVLLTFLTTAAPAAAAASPQPAIEGHIFNDPGALADPRYFVPSPGVSVRLYRDGGDNQPSSGDTLMATTQSGRGGAYTFHPPESGTYWVSVDSKTIPATTSGPQKVWAEQTYGPVHGLCAGPDDTIRELMVPGPCVGGKRVNRSDDGSNAETSEHIARVVLRDTPTAVDFAFSFNVVTSLDDAESDAHPIQGSLRQFVINANELSGPNAMRFVPLSRPEQSDRPMFDGDPTHWWTIALRRPLPPLRDADTTIDGAAFSFMSASSRRLPSRGWQHRKPVEELDVEPNADLEIVTRGEEGIVCQGRCTLRHLAVYGAAVSIVTHADALIEEVVAGAHADTRPVGARGTSGVQIERGKAVVRRTYVGDQNSGGIVVATSEARIDAEQVQVERCGQPDAGAAVVLLGQGSVLRSSLLRQNFGAGLVIGLPSGGQAARENLVADTIISGNRVGIVLSPGASDNRISGNALMWNRFGGIAVAPYSSSTAPLRNHISENRFDENGGRPISLDPNPTSNVAPAGVRVCTTNPALANGGVTPPQITSLTIIRNDNGQKRVVVRGEGCPSSTIELYQSYVTASLRQKWHEATRIRAGGYGDSETRKMTTETDLPSIGEFNPIASTLIPADGHFEFIVPVVPIRESRDLRTRFNRTAIRSRDDFDDADEIENTAFTALTIDSVGNSSELGVRHLIR